MLLPQLTLLTYTFINRMLLLMEYFHFPIMILASVFIFILIIRVVLHKNEFNKKRDIIFLMAFIVVVFGMFFGKYGAVYGLPWWIYYPVPMIATVFLPPVVFKLNKAKTFTYIALSALSAPFIHVGFSLFLGWTEYMPFWQIPSLIS